MLDGVYVRVVFLETTVKKYVSSNIPLKKIVDFVKNVFVNQFNDHILDMLNIIHKSAVCVMCKTYVT